MTLAMKFKEEREIARMESKVSVVRTLRGVVPEQTIAKSLGIDSDQLARLYTLIDTNPDMDDWDIATKFIYG